MVRRAEHKTQQAVGYVRVSSLEQAEGGISLDAQREKIRQWSALHSAELLGIYEDAGVSGTVAARKGLEKALTTAIENRAVLVVYSLSRFSRSTLDTLQMVSKLLDADANLVSISEQIDTISATGKMIFRVLSALNEFEADLGRERTKLALDYRKSKGLKTGGLVPFGYDAVGEDKKLVENPTEQRIVRIILRKKAKGMKLLAIANYLNSKGYQTKKGGKWYAQTVKNVINQKESRL